MFPLQNQQLDFKALVWYDFVTEVNHDEKVSWKFKMQEMYTVFSYV